MLTVRMIVDVGKAVALLSTGSLIKLLQSKEISHRVNTKAWPTILDIEDAPSLSVARKGRRSGGAGGGGELDPPRQRQPNDICYLVSLLTIPSSAIPFLALPSPSNFPIFRFPSEFSPRQGLCGQHHWPAFGHCGHCAGRGHSVQKSEDGQRAVPVPERDPVPGPLLRTRLHFVVSVQVRKGKPN